MLYLQQSLNPNEEIIRVGEFHWWYTFNASLGLVFGVIGMIAILYGGYYWEVYQFMNKNYSGLPDELKGQAWDESVKALGGFFTIMANMNLAIKIGAFIFFILGLLSFIQKMVIKYTTEICLTTDRLALKRGLVARHVEEISVDRIEGVDVAQGIMGRIFNFGRVSARGMGVGEISLPRIAEPIAFKKAIDRARSIRRSGNDQF